MNNPFDVIDRRLAAIETVLQDLRKQNTANAPSADAEPFGDFGWLQGVCAGIPASTLRIKSAAGQIPGTSKIGKRVIYNKAEVLNWLRSQTQPTKPDAAELEQDAEQQVNAQLEKRAKRTPRSTPKSGGPSRP